MKWGIIPTLKADQNNAIGWGPERILVVYSLAQGSRGATAPREFFRVPGQKLYFMPTAKMWELRLSSFTGPKSASAVDR